MNDRLLITLIILPIWLVLVLLFRKYRQWLGYYLIASFGFTIMLILTLEYLHLDQILVNIASFHVELIAKFLLHFNIDLLSNGRFQLLTSQGSNDILKLGIECSAVLESSILISLVLFYPLFGAGQKALRITFGLVVTYIINILRLLIIVIVTAKLGSDYIFIAHAGIARAFFFIFELILYWYLLTKPTVKSVGESIIYHVPLPKAAITGRSLSRSHSIAQLIIILFVLLASSVSFLVTDEWKKAFVNVATPARPIIYDEETALSPAPDQIDQNQPIQPQVLGEQTPGVTPQPSLSEIIYSPLNKLSDIISLTFPALNPKTTSSHRFVFNYSSFINLRLAKSTQPLIVKVYLNDKLYLAHSMQYNSVTKKEDILDKNVFIQPGDILQVSVTNVGTSEDNYRFKLTNNKENNE